MKGLVFVLSIFLLSACVKSNNPAACTDVTPAAEEPTILSFAAVTSMTPTKDPSGLYYQVIVPGMLPTPDLNDSVSVIYQGEYLDGTIFAPANTTPIAATVGDFIDGWRIGLQKIGKGGRIKLVIPSSLAYGCRGYSSVPPNTILYFDVTLVDVKQNP
jgi:FKBP-type peptidyl-prolyl cis-trans isomerase FkpA